MTVTSVNTDTFIGDTVILIRDDLRDNITDPISGSRASNERFVMTSFPQRNVRYPIITVQNTNVVGPIRLGMQSELHFVSLPLEIRVWARNVKERDTVGQDVINRLRDNDIGGTVDANLHDFTITSAVNIDDPGEEGIKSKVITVQYKFVLGAT